MQVLTYGLNKPETGDKGSVFFPALEANITQLDSHNHDGVNSPKVPITNITVATQAIASGSWVSAGNGRYKQTVSMSGGKQYDDYFITFRETSTGHQLGLTCEKVGATSYDVYINDNSLDVTAYYLI